MNHQQKILEALLILSTGWNTSPSKETIKLYVHQLSYADPLILQRAMLNLLSKCKFLPSFAEIESEYKELDNYINGKEELMTAQEAYGVVEDAVRLYSYEHGLEHLDGITKQAAQTIWSAFNPWNGDYNRAACMSQFVRCYEELVKRKNKNDEKASEIKNDGLLLEMKMKKEEESKQIEAGNAQIKMLPNGHLIETVKEERKPVNLNEILDNADISEKGKALLRQAIGG